MLVEMEQTHLKGVAEAEQEQLEEMLDLEE
jgi:hypothetical protein